MKTQYGGSNVTLSPAAQGSEGPEGLSGFGEVRFGGDLQPQSLGKLPIFPLEQ